jgi:hypothetical protein
MIGSRLLGRSWRYWRSSQCVANVTKEAMRSEEAIRYNQDQICWRVLLWSFFRIGLFRTGAKGLMNRLMSKSLAQNG